MARETVTQRAIRRRYAKIGRRGKWGSAYIERPSVPVQSNESMGCLARGLLVLVPIVVDAALWYAAAHGYSEAAGPAFVGAPIAFMTAFVAAQAR